MSWITYSRKLNLHRYLTIHRPYILYVQEVFSNIHSMLALYKWTRLLGHAVHPNKAKMVCTSVICVAVYYYSTRITVINARGRIILYHPFMLHTYRVKDPGGVDPDLDPTFK